MFDLQFYAEIDWKCRKCREGNGRLQRTVISDKLTLILICVDWRESESGEWELGHWPLSRLNNHHFYSNTDLRTLEL